MIKIVPIILVLLYNLTLLIGTAYLVTIWNWSAWWFVATWMLLGRTKENDDRSKPVEKKCYKIL